MRFVTLADLKSCKEQLSKRIKPGREIWVCGGPGCLASGSPAVAEEFKRLISERSSDGSPSFWRSLKVIISHEENVMKTAMTGCMGPCESGPVVHVEPEGWYYQKVTALLMGNRHCWCCCQCSEVFLRVIQIKRI